MRNVECGMWNVELRTEERTHPALFLGTQGEVPG